MSDLQFPLGTVSHGTLLPGDLARAFFGNATRALAAYFRRAGDNDSALDIENLMAKESADFWEADSRGDSDTMSECLMFADNLLNDHCPPFTYFGAHEGDGSDFGFWPCDVDFGDMDSDERALFNVNDHGNLALYDRPVSDPKSRLIWAIV